MLRCFLMLVLLAIAMNVAATPAAPVTAAAAKIECKLVFSKIPCWRDYTVYVEMIDAITQKAIQNFELKGKNDKDLTTTLAYDCQKHPQVNFRTHYSPNIWKGDENKVYTSAKVWDIASELSELPDTTLSNATTITLTIKVAFPTNFSEVPSPAICDQGKAIPKIPTR